MKLLYLQKISSEFDASSGSCREIESVYIGGGTPSFFSVKELEMLFSMIMGKFRILPSAEFSIECNPETLDPEKAALLATYVNRVSLGAQSFDEARRQVLGRRGSPESIGYAISLLRRAGLRNLGLDLIYAVPGQGLDDWRRELEASVALGVTHISAYALTLEEGSRLAKDAKIHLPSDELAAEMWEFAGEFLSCAGFQRYEISNYARPSFECSHNDAIWHGASYLGSGPAASSFDGVRRWTQVASLAKWTEGAAPEMDEISPFRRAREIFVMGLRTASGWHLSDFRTRTNFDFCEWKTEWEPLVKEGLLAWHDEILRPTQRGMLCWDGVAETFL